MFNSAESRTRWRWQIQKTARASCKGECVHTSILIVLDHATFSPVDEKEALNFSSALTISILDLQL